MRKQSCTDSTIILHVADASDFIIDVPAAHFRQVMWSHKLFKYCESSWVGCIWEGRYRDANIPVFVFCIYRLNITLMLIKHAENDLKLKMVEGISWRKLLFSWWCKHANTKGHKNLANVNIGIFQKIKVVKG